MSTSLILSAGMCENEFHSVSINIQTRIEIKLIISTRRDNIELVFQLSARFFLFNNQQSNIDIGWIE